MKSILLTGAAGMLGSSIFQAYSDKFKIIPITRESLDITDLKAVTSIVRDLSPDVIIHAAAYTNVEQAESSPDECYRVNYIATMNLLNAAKKTNSKLIYPSSTGCYGDHKTEPYLEYDPVLPTTVYHRSKFEGEKAVIELSENFLILRLGWLYGGDVRHKKNFVYNRFLEAKKEKSIISDPFQFGNPTNVAEVAKQIEQLIAQDVVGTFNLVSEGSCSRYEYVKAIIEEFNLNCEVIKANTPFKRKARVSPNEAAINFNLKTMGLDLMNDWHLSLSAYINNLKQNV